MFAPTDGVEVAGRDCETGRDDRGEEIGNRNHLPQLCHGQTLDVVWNGSRVERTAVTTTTTTELAMRTHLMIMDGQRAQGRLCRVQGGNYPVRPRWMSVRP